MTRKASANLRYSPGGISASLAAGFADEVRLDVGEPNIIHSRSPLIALPWLHLQSKQ
jgi:hypothetical protein